MAISGDSAGALRALRASQGRAWPERPAEAGNLFRRRSHWLHGPHGLRIEADGSRGAAPLLLWFEFQRAGISVELHLFFPTSSLGTDPTKPAHHGPIAAQLPTAHIPPTDGCNAAVPIRSLLPDHGLGPPLRSQARALLLRLRQVLPARLCLRPDHMGCRRAGLSML